MPYVVDWTALRDLSVSRVKTVSAISGLLPRLRVN